jgi:hypothetical protein
LSFYEEVGVGVLKIEESEVLYTDSITPPSTEETRKDKVGPPLQTYPMKAHEQWVYKQMQLCAAWTDVPYRGAET